MSDSTDQVSVVWDYYMVYNILEQILWLRQRRTWNENMDRRDHSTRLHFWTLLLCKCILPMKIELRTLEKL